MLELYDSDFKGKKIIRKFAQDKYGIIIFHVPWCYYCKKALPEMEAAEEISKSPNTSLYFAKVNCQNNPEITKRLGINKYPTIYFINKDGSIGSEYNGERYKHDIISYLCVRTRGAQGVFKCEFK